MTKQENKKHNINSCEPSLSLGSYAHLGVSGSHQMNNQLTEINFLSMTSREIADLCGKEINHVNRDIKVMLEQLNDVDPKLDTMYKTVSYKQKVGFGERDNLMYYLNKELTLTLVSGYQGGAVKPHSLWVGM